MLKLSYISSPVAEKVSLTEEFEKKSFRQVMDEHLARCKAKGTKKRPRSGQYTNSDPLIKFLRERVCRLNFGEKVGGKVYPKLDTLETYTRERGKSED